MDRCYSVLEIRAVDDGARVIRGVASTPDPDRMGDIVEPLGLSFKNPVPLLWQHDHSAPVGTVKFDKPTRAGVTFEATLPRIAEPGRLKDRVDEAWQSVKAGIVRAVSIGFRALESSRMENGGLRFITSELLELSLVSVPANSAATITSIKSIDRQLRAASGSSQAVRRKPGASGMRRNSNPGNSEMDIETQIAELEARREELVADMKSFGDVTDLDDDQEKEYQAVVAEFEKNDKQLAHERRLANAMSTARPISGASREKGSASRGRDPLPATPKKDLPKGERFTRLIMSKMVAVATGGDISARQYAQQRFGDTPEIGQILKAGEVGSTIYASPGWGSELVETRTIESEFIDLLRARTVVDRIEGLYLTDFHTSRGAMVGGSTAAWVGEGAPKPVTNPEFTNVALDYHKLAGITPFTVELERFARPNITQIIQRDLIGSIAEVIDTSFLTPAFGPASATSPAAVTYNVSGAAATGTDAEAFFYDLNAMLASFDSDNLDMATLVLVTTPALARGLSSLMNFSGSQAFPSMTPNGGSINGIPVLVSNNAPSGNVIAIVANEILFADDGVSRIAVSRDATLDLSGSTNATYSLFQNNAVAVLVERAVSWKYRRPSGTPVNRIHTAAYGPQGDSSP